MQKSTRVPDANANGKYVPALREPTRIVEVEVMRDLPVAPQTVLMPKASYEDRARGFSLATAPLAGVAGLVAGLVAITAFSVPVLSVAALLVVLAGFVVAWLFAYVVYTFVSPDGSLFLHTVFVWSYLRREQRERFKRYKKVNHE